MLAASRSARLRCPLRRIPLADRSAASVPRTRSSALRLPSLWWLSLQMHQARSPKVVGHGSEEYRRVSLRRSGCSRSWRSSRWRSKIDASRLYLATAFPSDLVGLLVERKLARVSLHRARCAARRLQKVLVVGGERAAAELGRLVRRSTRPPATRCAACGSRTRASPLAAMTGDAPRGVPACLHGTDFTEALARSGCDDGGGDGHRTPRSRVASRPRLAARGLEHRPHPVAQRPQRVVVPALPPGRLGHADAARERAAVRRSRSPHQATLRRRRRVDPAVRCCSSVSWPPRSRSRSRARAGLLSSGAHWAQQPRFGMLEVPLDALGCRQPAGRALLRPKASPSPSFRS